MNAEGGAEGRRQVLRDPFGFRGPGAARQGTGQTAALLFALVVQQREARLEASPRRPGGRRLSPTTGAEGLAGLAVGVRS